MDWPALAGRLLPFRPAWSGEGELMDRPGHDADLLRDNLQDLRIVNRWLGGVELTLGGLGRLASGERGDLRVLDVACGGGDLARAVARWARGRGRFERVSVVATDLSTQIASLAAEDRREGVLFAAADGRRLPFGDGAFDVAMCSLVVHHLAPEDAEGMLREMGRVAKRGVVVNDIVRWWPGYIVCVLVTRLFSTNALTRHDGPLSVRKSFTRPELRRMLVRAGMRVVDERSYLGYRVAMTAVPG